MESTHPPEGPSSTDPKRRSSHRRINRLQALLAPAAVFIMVSAAVVIFGGDLLALQGVLGFPGGPFLLCAVFGLIATIPSALASGFTAFWAAKLHPVVFFVISTVLSLGFNIALAIGLYFLVMLI